MLESKEETMERPSNITYFSRFPSVETGTFSFLSNRLLRRQSISQE